MDDGDVMLLGQVRYGYKIDKRRQAQAEELMSDPEDQIPRLTIWSDSESEDEKPTRPKWRKWVYFQNKWGEEFEGRDFFK